MKKLIIAFSIALLVSCSAYAQDDIDCEDYPEDCSDMGDPGTGPADADQGSGDLDWIKDFIVDTGDSETAED